MTLIFINRYFFPDHSATSQLLSDVAFSLAGAGHEVHVICSRQLYESPSARLADYERVREVQVHRVWTSRFGRTNLVGRTSDYLSFYASATRKLYVLARSGTVVVAKTDPPMISVPTAWVARWRGARLVNWLQDIFPEVAVELGVKALSGRIGALARDLRDISLRAAVVNVVLGERMADRVRACGVDGGKVKVIPNWADGDAIMPLSAKANPLRAEWGLADKFVVMYSGNMGRAHALAPIIAAAEVLHHEKSIVFLLIGDGAGRGPLQQEVAARGLTNVLFRAYQPREKLRFSLTLPDVHLVSLKPELEGLIVPSKAYGVFAAGRPMLFMGAADGEIGRLLSEAECGAVVPSGDGDSLAASILALKNAPDRGDAMGLRARALFEQRFSQTAALAAWEQVLVEVGNGIWEKR